MNYASLIGIALWALIPGFIAKKKGRSFVAYYFLSFVITPLVTTIIILCLRKLDVEEETEEPIIINATSKEADESVESLEYINGKTRDMTYELASQEEPTIEQLSLLALPEQSSTAIENGTDDLTGNQSEDEIVTEESDESQVVRYCRKCGYQLMEDSVYCSRCGTKVVDMTVICANCGTRLINGVRFCHICGMVVS